MAFVLGADGVYRPDWVTEKYIKNPLPLEIMDKDAGDDYVEGYGPSFDDIPEEYVSIENIPLNKITSIQKSINELSGQSNDEPVSVIKTPNGYMLIDGNHRVAEALKKGKTEIKAKVVELVDILYLLSEDDA
jgi:hypothetical protein